MGNRDQVQMTYARAATAAQILICLLLTYVYYYIVNILQWRHHYDTSLLYRLLDTMTPTVNQCKQAIPFMFGSGGLLLVADMLGKNAYLHNQYVYSCSCTHSGLAPCRVFNTMS